MRFCDCGCADCRAQTQQHTACQLECETEEVPSVPRHGREIIVIK